MRAIGTCVKYLFKPFPTILTKRNLLVYTDGTAGPQVHLVSEDECGLYIYICHRMCEGYRQSKASTQKAK